MLFKIITINIIVTKIMLLNVLSVFHPNISHDFLGYTKWVIWAT